MTNVAEATQSAVMVLEQQWERTMAVFPFYGEAIHGPVPGWVSLPSRQDPQSTPPRVWLWDPTKLLDSPEPVFRHG